MEDLLFLGIQNGKIDEFKEWERQMVLRERTEKIKNPNIEQLNRGSRREREVVIQEWPIANSNIWEFKQIKIWRRAQWKKRVWYFKSGSIKCQNLKLNRKENLKNSRRIEREVVIQERSESPPISSTLGNSCKGLDIFCNSFFCKSYSNH